jgi:hypothetical protein
VKHLLYKLGGACFVAAIWIAGASASNGHGMQQAYNGGGQAGYQQTYNQVHPGYTQSDYRQPETNGYQNQNNVVYANYQRPTTTYQPTCQYQSSSCYNCGYARPVTYVPNYNNGYRTSSYMSPCCQTSCCQTSNCYSNCNYQPNSCYNSQYQGYSTTCAPPGCSGGVSPCCTSSCQ